VIAVSSYPLRLAGYDHASTWGYDAQSATYFAQLWRNSSDSDEEPDASLNWFTSGREIDSPQRLAELICDRTSASVAQVLRSMAAGPVGARVRRLAGARRPPGDF
jgi:hypothetical protein